MPPTDAALAAIDALVADAIAAGTCSAAAAAIGGPGHRHVWVRGAVSSEPPGAPIDATSPFDLASLTKPMATAMIAHGLVEDGRLALDDAAARWLPGLPDGATIAHLLGHASGLPPHRKLYERLWAGEGADDPRAALVAMAAAVAPERAPGVEAVYSDVGYIALGAICERAGDAPLERLAAAALAPLGLEATRYADLARGERIAGAVATERDPRRGLVAGEVHDENAHAAGGIAGHAGLFAPIGDVATFAAALARGPVRGAGRLSPARVRDMFTRTAAPGASWRLGWDTPCETPGVSTAGDAWPRAHAVGHLGFTGTSMWLDWAGGHYAVLLTNRVHPSRDRPAAAGIRPLRRAFGDLAWAYLRSTASGVA